MSSAAIAGCSTILIAAAPTVAVAQPSANTVATMTDSSFMPLRHDAAKGRVLLEVPAFDQDVLYYVSAASGSGSVGLPLDRGILRTAVVHFVRDGDRVQVVEQNLDYRSLNGDAAHKQVVADSFPTSVLASLPIESTTGGKVMADATGLFMRDAAGIEAAMARLKQGRFRFDTARSRFEAKRLKAFPENTEIETVATFVVDEPGALVRNVTPEPRLFSMRIHHSFLKAPSGYVPRQADPRIGVSAVRFRDYSKPVSENTNEAWVTRWRLEKADPAAAMSRPKKPIVFYFDPGIPAEIRHAMKAGLLGWNKAFEKAGFIEAIEARDAPADMDPMDIRYAYVQWINRDERGFSSGGTYRDPRTGEILGSKTRMDSHRVRTIANYWDAYAAGLPGDGTGVMAVDPALVLGDAMAGMPVGQRSMILERQALLTAHELGHALGFGHNFASSLNDRASVMEYPTPRVKVVNGRLDLSEAFEKQTGAYDAFMVRYAYTPLPAAAEKAGLDAIIADMRGDGIIYVPNTDPRWTWYDDRATPTAYLDETMAARRIMLADYGSKALSAGEPVGALRDARLWMVYLHHRYAIESGLNYIGNQYQNIVVPGDPLPPTEPVPASLQRDVMARLMAAIAPEGLMLPDDLLAMLTSDPGGSLEDLSSDAVFDQLRAARILTALVIEPLFDSGRAARMVALEARGGEAFGFAEMVDMVMANSWDVSAGTGQEAALRRVTQKVVLDAMMILGAATDGSETARAYVLDTLARLGASLEKRRANDALTAAFYRQSARDIARYLEDPAGNAPKSASSTWGGFPRSRFPMPPGPPLG
ncbi:MAG: zinc-dependent metalloprotease [Polymorphobacter sp.]|uniref:zinc-dependent metalloprotease n=1 Tax=Polymorphobacter sp. TaxID=1909290 RepID=UPI003A8C6221